jgi:hypothetical protein
LVAHGDQGYPVRLNGRSSAGTGGGAAPFCVDKLEQEAHAMRSILLMLLGVPLPIILLLAFCTHHF